MQDFEKLGAFYLGKRFDEASQTLADELILYDSRDLTTHAVIIGMTGSGKTGLGIGMIEEAALDHVPVIAIDPKGDLGNLLLTFPKLRAEDFEPWVDPQAATESAQDVTQFAASTAALWKRGLAEWGQTPARIHKLRTAADMAIYTPGSSSGIPLSVLKEFAAPAAELLEDEDLYCERLRGTANGLLTLLGIDGDPLTSREHILVATLLDREWREGHSLDLPALIGAIQNPGVQRVGVMDLDAFYPAKDRFALAMQLNNLLAAPGFEAWMQGEALSVDALLHTPAGQPRVSVLSIAHLDDAQRMFFVTMLLGELITWMRRQPGSASLRAVLYMDEIFGYMPPVANPPSKQLFLTLLKQARAYGVGLVLATQNPVDLDYKGLSNTGTWFIGRLQTERDKARVRDGLQGATGSEHLDAKQLERTLSGLGKRRFLLHNVHEQAPVIFQTRWVMSYLAGPLTRDHIKRLVGERVQPPGDQAPAAARTTTEQISSARPVLAPAIKQAYLPTTSLPGEGERLVYCPRVLAAAKLAYSNARLNINEQRELMLAAICADGPVNVDWNQAQTLVLAPGDLESEPEPDGSYAHCPTPMANAKSYPAWERQLKRWLRDEQVLTIYRSPLLKAYSQPGESERAFRIRLQQLANEARDLKVAKLRKRYEAKVGRLEERLRRAEQVVEREAEQARGYKIDTAISFGTAVLGAVLGRKRVSTTSASRIGTAVRKAGTLRKHSGDVERAKETVTAVQAQLEELQIAFDEEVDELEEAYDAQAEELTETVVRPKATDIHIRFVSLGWAPFIEDGFGELHPA